ncbi:hypothetical protein CRM22_005027 [Opisthorchis felineus]|uniref:Uncharacterized protein n=1 Tax=Opisthorchis felineus TaxID=147828 RepID=A0A4S2LZR6_OPIFE|nr:hypothetical protein CRM22_005027 [Opisthorchis felineus]
MVLMLQVALFLTLASPFFAKSVPLELVNPEENSGLEVKMRDVNESVVDRCTEYPCEVWVKRTRTKGKAYNLPILKVLSCNASEVKFKIKKVVKIIASQNEPGENRTVGVGLESYLEHIKEKLRREGKKLEFGPDIHYTLKTKTKVTIKVPGVTRISIFYKVKESDKGRKGYLSFKSKVKLEEEEDEEQTAEEEPTSVQPSSQGASSNQVSLERPQEKIPNREIQVDNFVRENALKRRLAKKMEELERKRRLEELKRAYLEQIRLKKYYKRIRRLQSLRRYREWLKRNLERVEATLSSEDKEELVPLLPPTQPNKDNAVYGNDEKNKSTIVSKEDTSKEVPKESSKTTNESNVSETKTSKADQDGDQLKGTASLPSKN